MSGNAILWLILNSFEQELLDDGEMYLVELSQSVEYFMCQQNWFSDILVWINHGLDWFWSVDVLQVEDGLVSFADGFSRILQQVEIFGSLFVGIGHFCLKLIVGEFYYIEI